MVRWQLVIVDEPKGDVELVGLVFHPEERDRGLEWFIDPNGRVLERRCADISPNGTVEWEVSAREAVTSTDIGPPAYI